MFKKISLLIVVCLLFVSSGALTGCSQKLSSFESSICGTYNFDDFWVYGNGISASYNSLNQINNIQIRQLVKEIGDYYSNSTLILSNRKSNDKLDGSFYQTSNKNIKWYTDGENISFDNLPIYTIQGTKTSPVKTIVSKASCVKSNSGTMLSIVYYSNTFTSCIWFEAK